MGEEYAEGVIDELRAVKGVELAMTSASRPSPTGRAARLDALVERRLRRLRDRPRAEGRRPQARRPGFSSDESVEEIIEFVRGEFARCRRARLSLAGYPGRQAGGPVVVPGDRGDPAPDGARTGHAGTLDPFAIGLLLVLSGAATRLAPWLVGLDKRY